MAKRASNIAVRRNAMAQTSLESDCVLEQYRSYLHLLAEVRMDHRLRSKLDPSDIVQETLLHAHQAWGGFHGKSEGEIAAWLRQILARNLLHCVRDMHRACRDVDREVSLQAAIEQSADHLERWLAAEQSSVSQKAVREEGVMELAKAIQGLPDGVREAIVLHYWQDCSLAEIGEHLGRSKAGVAGLLQCGVKLLRRQIAHQE
jgi:RNA polymerase sigma-70 factor, ECF subfamily